MYTGHQRYRSRHGTTSRTCLFGSKRFSQNIRGNNTLPGSTSFQLGVVESPVYLVITEEDCVAGASSDIIRRESRISRSCRTLVPCRATELNPKFQAMVVHDEPESA